MAPNSTAALASLPHGPSFRFVDELTSLEPGREGAAIYRIRGDEDFLTGRFPGQPMMPGVILVEAIARLGGGGGSNGFGKRRARRLAPHRSARR